MSKFKPNKNIKFSRKNIQRGERALNKLNLKHAEDQMVEEIESKIYSANQALAYFVYNKDYESIKTLCEEIETFAHDKWLGYIDPTIWTKEEREYIQEQFKIEIKSGKSNYDSTNLNFDADAFTNVEFIKHEGQKEIKYWVLTSCSFMEGYNDPMTSKYFDPTDLVAAKNALDALINRVKQDIKMNIAYVQSQKNLYANV